jgi:hypothetical protein
MRPLRALRNGHIVSEFVGVQPPAAALVFSTT